jgi:hypothetical protein
VSLGRARRGFGVVAELRSAGVRRFRGNALRALAPLTACATPARATPVRATPVRAAGGIAGQAGPAQRVGHGTGAAPVTSLSAAPVTSLSAARVTSPSATPLTGPVTGPSAGLPAAVRWGAPG